MEEISEDAALYFDSANVEDMAQKLMRVYKDEEERKGLIGKGILSCRKI